MCHTQPETNIRPIDQITTRHHRYDLSSSYIFATIENIHNRNRWCCWVIRGWARHVCSSDSATERFCLAILSQRLASIFGWAMTVAKRSEHHHQSVPPNASFYMFVCVCVCVSLKTKAYIIVCTWLIPTTLLAVISFECVRLCLLVFVLCQSEVAGWNWRNVYYVCVGLYLHASYWKWMDNQVDIDFRRNYFRLHEGLLHFSS